MLSVCLFGYYYIETYIEVGWGKGRMKGREDPKHVVEIA